MDDTTMHGSTRFVLTAVASLVLVALGGVAQAQYPSPRPPVNFIYPQAPDMKGPGFYWANSQGMAYGPSYYVRPCHMPFQGMVLAPQMSSGSAGPGSGMAGFPGVPYNPFVRSPRDFFMHE
jgi:hypothetical protein